MRRDPLLAAIAILVMLPVMASANGLNLNGLGTRAQGMGGAFVSVADDFSAAFWNPAGAAGFRKELFGFYAADLMPRASYYQFLEGGGTTDAKTPTQHYLGFLGGYYAPVGEKVVIGLAIGTPSGQGLMWNSQDFTGAGGIAYDRSSKVGIFSFSPLVAVKLNEWLSAGVTLNINLGTFGLKRPGGALDLGAGPVSSGQYEETMTGWGFGATFGILAKPFDTLSLGLTLRTPSTIAYKGTARLSNLPLYDLPGSSDLERKITWPLWIAGGVSFRPFDRLLLSADVHWTQWSRLDTIRTEYLDPVWRDLFAMVGVLDNTRMDLSWKDATQIRFGAEFSLNETTALRAGYTRDPAPGPDSRINILLPTHTFNVLSAGVGKAFGDLRLDLGLEYMAGGKRTVPDWIGFDGPPTFGMDIVVPSISVQYLF